MSTSCSDGDCTASNSTTTSNTTGQTQAAAAGEGVEFPELPDPFEPRPPRDAGASDVFPGDNGSGDTSPADGGFGDVTPDTGADAGSGPGVGPLMLMNGDLETAGVADITPLNAVYGVNIGGEAPMVATAGNAHRIISLRTGHLGNMDNPIPSLTDPDIHGFHLNDESVFAAVGLDGLGTGITARSTGHDAIPASTPTYKRKYHLPKTAPLASPWVLSGLGDGADANSRAYDVTAVVRKNATGLDERFVWWAVKSAVNGVKITRYHEVAGGGGTITSATLPADAREIYAIHAMVKDNSATASPITVVAVGESGEVLISTDGAGTTFTRDSGLGAPAFVVQRGTNSASPHLHGVWFAAPNPSADIVVVGESGTLARKNTSSWANLSGPVTGAGHLRGVFGAVAGNKRPVLVAGDNGMVAWADFAAAAPVFQKLDADTTDNKYLLSKTSVRGVWGTMLAPPPPTTTSSAAFWMVGSTLPIGAPEAFGTAWKLEFTP
ncbi:MAG: hypothetical protein GMKNLPBB_02557 [Myxococcota bacterium]|nr:hypothetical protein [Myxococcota bacterium]